MTPEPGTEEQLITQLGQSAIAHDKECNGDERCFNYRINLVAALMIQLELSIAEIGFVAEAIIDLECEESEDDPPDDVLNAKEVLG